MATQFKNTLQYPPGIENGFHVDISAKAYSMPSVTSTGDVSLNASQKGARVWGVKMYIPKDIEDGIAATWKQEKLTSTSQVAASVAQRAMNGQDVEWMKELGNFADAAGRDIISTVGGIAPGVSEWFSNQAGAMFGVLFRPNEINIMSGIGHNSIGFQWSMMANNAQEAEDIRQIVLRFREGLKPRLGGAVGFEGREVMVYPPIYDIRIVRQGANDGRAQDSDDAGDDLFSYQNMVLKDYKASYGGGANEMLFYRDGSPVTVNLSVEFEGLRPAYGTGDNEAVKAGI